MSESRFGPIADRYADQYGIPKEIFRSLINTESAWKPWARSKTGAIGLGQLTSVIYNSSQYKTNPWQPEQNIATSAKFLADLRDQYKGDWGDALAHYNAGFNLDAGREYALKVLSGAGYDTTSQINKISPSLTPLLDKYKPVKGSDKGGDQLKLADSQDGLYQKIFGKSGAKSGDDSELQKKMSEVSGWFADRFAEYGMNVIFILIAAILFFTAFKKFAGVK